MAGRRFSRTAQDFNVWPGFTDVMVALLLIFIFVVTIFTITETVLSHSLTKKDSELDRLNREILRATEQLERFKAEAGRLAELFGNEKTKSGSLEQLVEELRNEMDSVAAQLAEKVRLLADRETDLQSAEKQLSDQKSVSEEAQRVLETRQAELDASLAGLKDRTELLEISEQKLAQANLQIGEAENRVKTSQEDARQKESRIGSLIAEITTLNRTIEALNKKVEAYLSDISRLNGVLAESQQSEQNEKTKAGQLQKEIVSLRSQLEELSTRLAENKEADRQFKIGKLVSLIEQKDKEIDQLRKLAKYRSEFLSKLEVVFEGIPDIKIQGDRFIFQSEILFASGKETVNERGKKELDKFLKIYKEMVEKIPRDVDLVILVQGHTDDVPISSSKYKSNWDLAAARSMEVVRYLVAGGIPSNRVAAASFGEFHPVDVREVPEARRINRRIELKITSL